MRDAGSAFRDAKEYRRMTLSLCIAGCGRYARTVLQDIYHMTDDLRLFFASRDARKAEAYCKEFGGVDYFESYEQAVSDPRVDAMYFFTPHHVHLENARLAARHSKHVLIEKPIARTVAEAREMVRATQNAGVALMVAENYRFLPAVNRVKEMVGRGDIGDIRLIQIHSESYAEITGWRTRAELMGGGMLIDGGIHFVDILVNLAGLPERVYAVKPRQVLGHVEGEDGAVLTCHMPGGSIGLIGQSWGTPITGRRQQVIVTGTKGELRFSPSGSEITVDSPGGVRTERVADSHPAVQAMVREFKDSVAEDREPLMSGWEAMKDLAVVLAAYESMSRGAEATPELP